jgi:hypothetical protein
MTRARHDKRRSGTRKPGRRRPAARAAKAAKAPKPKAKPVAAPAQPQTLTPPVPGPTLASQTQIEIRLGGAAGPLTATEQAARLASARMERRIGRLLSRRVKLKFRQ